jgi:hypothetical protein
MQPNANIKPRAALHQSAPSANKRAISKPVTTRPLAPRRMDCRSPALPTKVAASAANLMALPIPPFVFAGAVAILWEGCAPAVDRAQDGGMLRSVDDSSVSAARARVAARRRRLTYRSIFETRPVLLGTAPKLCLVPIGRSRDGRRARQCLRLQRAFLATPAS